MHLYIVSEPQTTGTQHCLFLASGGAGANAAPARGPALRVSWPSSEGALNLGKNWAETGGFVGFLSLFHPPPRLLPLSPTGILQLMLIHQIYAIS